MIAIEKKCKKVQNKKLVRNAVMQGFRDFWFFRTRDTQKYVFLPYKAKIQKNGRARRPRSLLTWLLSNKKCKKVQNKKLVRNAVMQGFRYFWFFRTCGTKKYVFLLYKAKNQKNGRGRAPRTLLTWLLSKKNAKRSKIKN